MTLSFSELFKDEFRGLLKRSSDLTIDALLPVLTDLPLLGRFSRSSFISRLLVGRLFWLWCPSILPLSFDLAFSARS